MLAFNPSSLTIFARGQRSEELAEWLVELSDVGQKLGVDLLTARSPIGPIAEALRAMLTDRDRKLIANLHHELDHATVHLSTSFGAILNLLDQIFVHLMSRGLIDLAEDPATLQRWISDPDRRQVASLAKERSACDGTTYDLLCVRSLAAALLGRPGMRDDTKVSRGLATLLIYLHGHDGDPSQPFLLRIGPELQKYFRFEDPFQPYLNGSPIGATAIVEGQAVFVQEYELELLGLPLAELETFLAPPVSVYHLTQAVWLSFFQRRGLSDLVRVWEYLWALDLALWIPLFPDGSIKNWPWPDLHPGWRFLKICTWLESSGCEFVDDDATEEEVSKFEDSFIEMVCRAQGWPTPREIAAHWITPENDAVTLRFYGERNASGMPMHPRVRFMRSHFQRLCHGRSLDLSRADTAHFPVAAVICDDSAIMLPSGCWGMYDAFTGNRLTRLKDYVIYDFGRYWGLGDGLGSYLLREGMADLSSQWLGDAICKCTGCPEKLRTNITGTLDQEIRRIRR